MSVTFGVPTVIVPVLSSAITFILPASSREVAFLNKIPFFAPTPLPTIMETGVASPKAHGQLITSTEIALVSENARSFPKIDQIINVTIEIPITVGTKMPDTLSAILAMGALLDDASSTILMIRESIVSSPTSVARHFKKPERLMVAE